MCVREHKSTGIVADVVIFHHPEPLNDFGGERQGHFLSPGLSDAVALRLDKKDGDTLD